jgi:hypothetical protein
MPLPAIKADAIHPPLTARNYSLLHDEGDHGFQMAMQCLVVTSQRLQRLIPAV